MLILVEYSQLSSPSTCLRCREPKSKPAEQQRKDPCPAEKQPRRIVRLGRNGRREARARVQSSGSRQGVGSACTGTTGATGIGVTGVTGVGVATGSGTGVERGVGVGVARGTGVALACGCGRTTGRADVGVDVGVGTVRTTGGGVAGRLTVVPGPGCKLKFSRPGIRFGSGVGLGVGVAVLLCVKRRGHCGQPHQWHQRQCHCPHPAGGKLGHGPHFTALARHF